MLVVGPNLSLDETVAVPYLQVGTICRVDGILRLAGGKGANVARALRVLGAQPLLIGYVGGAPGELLRSYLEDEGINHVLVPVRGETRTCFTIVDEGSDKQTEFYGAGPDVSANEVGALLRAVTGNLDGQRWLVVTGSPPPGVPDDLYGHIIELAHERGARTLIDANGAALKSGIAAGSDVVKVNVNELGDVIGAQPHVPHDIADAAARLLNGGVGVALITLGADGAVLVAPGVRLHLRGPRRKVVSPVGSGDAAAAAMVLALDRGEDLESAARASVAAGTANALHLGAGRFSRADYEEMLQECEVVALE